MSIRLLAAVILVGFRLTAGEIRGVVEDAQGARVAGAEVWVLSATGAPLRSCETSADGAFVLDTSRSGVHVLRVTARGFAATELPVAESVDPVVRLTPMAIASSVTVTASRGSVEDVRAAPRVSDVIDRAELLSAPLATIGNALEGSAGILVQQSTQGQVSPFLRGMTGNQVLNLVDGIRFNNSTYRFGPNQYLALIDGAQIQRLETSLGPAGAQYGSDALGGAIQMLTIQPVFAAAESIRIRGEIVAGGASADLSTAASAHVELSTERLFWLMGASWRRHNDLRAGHGNDSHHVLRRYFGLGNDQIRALTGSRLQDTAFTQGSGQMKFAVRLSEEQSLTFWYQRNELIGVRSYKDLLGGLGQLRSDFNPQALDFAYLRYERWSAGPLSSVTGTLSWNSQSDGTVRQGARYTDPLIRDKSRVNAFGYTVQAASMIGLRHAQVFGAESYLEDVDSSRTQNGLATRPLYPAGSHYNTWAVFGHNSSELGRSVRVSLGGRLTGVRFSTPEDQRFGVSRSNQQFTDATFSSSVRWRANDWLGIHALVGRGFRAPNLNDLGALGLNDLGYEVPAEEAQRAGALMGASSSDASVSLGRPVEKLRAESLYNYEAGVTARTRRSYARVQIFDAELYDPIVRRTLLFPANGVPATLAGLAVTAVAPAAAQVAQGVTAVATGIDPRAVKAFVNDGRQRYYGVEAIAEFQPDSHWHLALNYNFLVGRDLNPNRNLRRLPPQQGLTKVRWSPRGGRFWVEGSALAAGAQERLSGGDLSDERIGADRRRRDVATFFTAAVADAFVAAGPDRIRGTADDVLIATGETSTQVMDRMLPTGSMINGVRVTDDEARVPLYAATPGWLSFTLAGGWSLGESSSITIGLANLLDRNYRVHGSGVDAPGRNLLISYRYSF